MRCLILTPGIRDEEEIRALQGCLPPDRILLTNPLYQQDGIQRIFPGAACLDADTLVDPRDYRALNEQAKTLSRIWYETPVFREKLLFRNINLGSLHTRLFQYFLVGLLKALSIYQALFRQEKIQAVELLDDGTYWSQMVKDLCVQKGIECRVLYARQEARDSYEASLIKKKPPFGGKVWWIGRFKQVLAALNFYLHRGTPKGGWLCSASLRYVQSCFGHAGPVYYLREALSFKALKKLSRVSGWHVLLEYFKPRQKEARTVTAIVQILQSAPAPEEYKIQEYPLWPWVRQYLIRVVETEYFQMQTWILSFQSLLRNLKPSAVIVDEDVCVFNKTLVICARQMGIPTFVMVHGVPYYEIGTIPATSDYILAWGESSRERFHEWGVPQEKIIEVGAPQYQHFKTWNSREIRKDIFRQYAIPEDKQLIMLAAPPFRTNEHPDFLGSPLSAVTAESVFRITLDFVAAHEPAFVLIKTHPADKNIPFLRKIIAGYAPQVQKRVLLLREGDASYMIAGCDLALTYGSTVYFEGMLLKKPIAMLDYGHARYFDFMAQHFLDLDRPEQCFSQMEHFLTPRGAASLIGAQTAAIGRHFYRQNELSASQYVTQIQAVLKR